MSLSTTHPCWWLPWLLGVPSTLAVIGAVIIMVMMMMIAVLVVVKISAVMVVVLFVYEEDKVDEE